MSAAHEQLPTIKAKVQSLLDLQYKGGVELDAGSAAAENDHVWRLQLLNRPADAPASFITRQAYINFETSAFRPALTDGVVMRMHFPISPCVYQLSPSLLQRTEAAYRSALGSGCPAAADDTLFGRAIVEGCAYWALITCRWSTLPDVWCNLPALLAADPLWGTATMRQPLLARLTSAAQATVEFAHLPALGATFAALATHLRKQWPAKSATLPQLPLSPKPCRNCCGNGIGNQLAHVSGLPAPGPPPRPRVRR